MTILAVTFDGVRLHSSDNNTGWGNYGSGGGAPASEGANAYQITTGAAANTGVVGTAVKLTAAAKDGIDYIGSAVDFTAAANRLWYVKAYVTDAFDLQTAYGVEISMGSVDQSNYHEYCVAGTDANLPVYNTWPPQGGYLITCIDPTIDTWAEVADSGGAFDQTAVIWYGFAVVFINGNSKSENVALDAIDYGTGLTLVSGDGANDPGAYTSFVIADQDDIDKRWGAAIGGGDAVIFRGVATIGAAGTATEFTDETSIVTFPDGYHSRGLFGVSFDIGNASSIMADGATLIGAGTRNGVDANDTRPDYEVIGTSGSYIFTGVMRNFRDVAFTSVCDVNGAIECMLLTQGSANIENAIISCNALTNVATLQDPTFGSTTDLNNTLFKQTGVGHAIEALGSASYTNITFSGFGGTPGSNLVAGTGAADAAVFNDTGGAITITVVGGDSPSVRNGAGATTTVIQTVSLNVTVKDADAVALEDVIVSIRDSSDNSLVSQGRTAANGIYTDGTYNYGGDLAVTIEVRKSSPGDTRFLPKSDPGLIESTGLSVTVGMTEDTTAGTIDSTRFDISKHGQVSNDVSGTTITAKVKLPGGTSRKLVVAGFYWDSTVNRTVTSFSYDGNAMVDTAGGNFVLEGANYHEVFLYRYDIPDSDIGTKDIVLTLSGAANFRAIAFAVINLAGAGAEEDDGNSVGQAVTTNPTISLNNTTQPAISVMFSLTDDLDTFPPAASGVGSIRRADKAVDGLKQITIIRADRVATGAHSIGADYDAASKSYVSAAATFAD